MAPLQSRSLVTVSVGGDFYQFVDGELIQISDAFDDALSVADSFLLRDGAVRAPLRHFERFAGSIDDEKTSRQLPVFFAEAVRILPTSGDWFPRFEYRPSQPIGQRLFLRIRTAPERTETCRLWTSPESDPRSNPAVKGPDLSICQQLRRAANLHGADEAVITDQHGFIADGALSSIVWWRGSKLFGPNNETAWLPSITRELVFSLAMQAGYETAEEKAKPEDLAGCEIWSLSALQGIRGVTSWSGSEVGELSLLSPFVKRLNLLAEPLPEPNSLIAQFS